MHKGIRRKLKVYAVDAAMIFLAAQVTIVLNDSRTAQAYAETILIPERETEAAQEDPEETEATECSSIIASRDWDADDSEILVRIAMAEAESEGTEGKALVMLVVLNRVWSDDFPDSISEVVFEEGQFNTTVDGGRYWDVEPDEECYEALYMVQTEGWDESGGALYFCRPESSSWMEQNTEYLFTAGNHNFYK